MYLLPFQNLNYFREEDSILRWNQIDASQFDTDNIIWFNAASESPFTGSVTIETVEDGLTGASIIKITATNLSGGFIIPLVQDIDSTRYHIFVNQLSGTNSTARYLTGLFLQDLPLGNGFVHKRSSGTTSQCEFLGIESGSQSGNFGDTAPAVDMNQTTHRRGGLNAHFFINKRPSVLGEEDFDYSVAKITLGSTEQGYNSMTSLSASFTWDDGFVSTGNSSDMTKVGFGIVNDSAPIAEIIFYIRDFAIIKHPLDRFV